VERLIDCSKWSQQGWVDACRDLVQCFAHVVLSKSNGSYGSFCKAWRGSLVWDSDAPQFRTNDRSPSDPIKRLLLSSGLYCATISSRSWRTAVQQKVLLVAKNVCADRGLRASQARPAVDCVLQVKWVAHKFSEQSRSRSGLNTNTGNKRGNWYSVMADFFLFYQIENLPEKTTAELSNLMNFADLSRKFIFGPNQSLRIVFPLPCQ
jgi:hypothetical protein